MSLDDIKMPHKSKSHSGGPSARYDFSIFEEAAGEKKKENGGGQQSLGLKCRTVEKYRS